MLPAPASFGEPVRAGLSSPSEVDGVGEAAQDSVLRLLSIDRVRGGRNLVLGEELAQVSEPLLAARFQLLEAVQRGPTRPARAVPKHPGQGGGRNKFQRLFSYPDFSSLGGLFLSTSVLGKSLGDGAAALDRSGDLLLDPGELLRLGENLLQPLRRDDDHPRSRPPARCPPRGPRPRRTRRVPPPSPPPCSPRCRGPKCPARRR